MKRSRLAIIALIAASVVAGGFWLWMRFRTPGAEAADYETAEVTRGEISSRVTATGTLSPLVTVEVGSQVSGRIQELYADFNSHVEKGEVIAKLDPQFFESDVARQTANQKAAEAGLESARADLADARQKYERAKNLSEKQLVSPQDVESAQAAFDVARARVTSAQAAVSQARAALQQSQTNLAYTTIVSPITGIVISRNVDVGQTVAASLQAPVLFTIAEDLRKMEVHTNVAESDVGSVRTGMPVEFTVDAWPGERFQGTVKEVRYSPQTVQNVVTYDAVISVANTDLKLRPGMTADVSFVVAERRDALLVPNAALRFQPPPDVVAGVSIPEIGARASVRDGVAAEEGGGAGDRQAPLRAGEGGAPVERRWGNGGSRGSSSHEGGQERIVWTLADAGQPRPVLVRTGLSDGRNTEVLAGLEAGARVIVGMSGGAAGSEGASRPRFGRIL